MHSDLDALVFDLPGPGAIVTSATDRGWNCVDDVVTLLVEEECR
jgi:hypothetical protein